MEEIEVMIKCFVIRIVFHSPILVVHEPHNKTHCLFLDLKIIEQIRISLRCINVGHYAYIILIAP